ncbi:transporter substrate-binding domain-containing protein [Herbaspirillum sp. LeCh32-8]|jgi:polar amino acid transport system substrate-binding protein|uniref:LacI family transcriptional regulator n=1 Tax=Herbaspirillum robiniae TaxID=2014887 RepID=A0A246WQR3_9BURK|nr:MULTISPECIES: transporter substrate-binding domain-containing protein [Herbaspirillum]MBP0597892.1 transporter substrate-binding domain-containing protein [Herbaspirillum sp. LeCh32-8]NUU02254.1 transporter substrate-binding domain-containing protein [Herbaspirillum robiniae]OWY28731.1 LacI family transcriptional regulator [Herbaspirillum robiniae]
MSIKKLFSTKFIALTLAATCAVAGAASASAQSIAELTKKGKITIGVVSGTPPFGSVDAKGVPIGYDVDVANLIGKYLGLPVEIVPLVPPARIPALESGKVDMLAATLAPTPERAKAVLFTIPYSGFELSIVGPVGSNYKKLDDLVKKKVGVSRGSTNDTALTRLAPPGTTLVRFEDDSTVTQALLSNQVDAISIPNTMATEIVKTRGQGKIEVKFPYSVQPNSMTVRKGSYELQQWLNNFIYYVKLNGELDAISRKWAGPLPNLPVF